MTATIKEEHDDPDDPEQKPVVSILVYLHSFFISFVFGRHK